MFEVKRTDLSKLTYEQLLDIRLKVNNRITAIEDKALNTLTAGKTVRGFRLKKGRKVRSIPSVPTLITAITEKFPIAKKDLYKKTVLGIPAIEELIVKSGATKEQTAIFLHDHVTVTFSANTLTYVGD